MSDSCHVPTPSERRYIEIEARAQTEMLDKAHAALDHAARQVAEAFAAEGLDMPPPSRAYFMSVLHQKLFLTLCGADPDTMRGGDPVIAFHLLNNGRNISQHYWGMSPEDAVKDQPGSGRDAE